MNFLGHAQVWVLGALAIVIFVVQVIALGDAARRPARAFTAEGKQTKNLWLVILAIAAVLGFLGLPPAFVTAGSFLNLIALAPALIYWYGVRPAIKPYGTGGPRRPQGPQW